MHGRHTMSGRSAKMRFMPRTVGTLPLGCLSPTGHAQTFKRPIASNFELEAACEARICNVYLLPADRNRRKVGSGGCEYYSRVLTVSRVPLGLRDRLLDRYLLV